MEDEANLDLTQDASVAPTEKMLPQSQVNELIGREKAAVAERVRRQLESQYQQAQQSQSSQMGAPAVDMEALKQDLINQMHEEQRKAAEEADKKALAEQEEEYKRQLQQVGDAYQMKMTAGKDKYSDFDEVMQEYDMNAFPHVAFLATEMEMTPDIMYELAQNSLKAASLNDLAQKSPKSAVKELQKLEDSIKKNQEALNNNPSAPMPLDRPKSSPTAGMNNGEMTVRDFKNADWLRG